MKYFGGDSLDTIESASVSQQAMKRANLTRVFEAVKQGRNASRATVAKVTHLTPTTVSSLVEELIDMGLVMQVGIGTSVTGRKPILLELDPAGVQIPVLVFRPLGMLYTLYDLRFNQLEQIFCPYSSKLVAKKTNGDAPVLYRETDGSELAALAEELLRSDAKKIDWAKVRTVCLTIPGTFSWDDRRFTSSVLQIKTSTRFVEEIHRRLGHMPLLIGNESPVRAYAERCARGGKVPNLIFINIGNGVGMAEIVEGEMVGTAYGNTCEFGHMSIDMNGQPCFCGNRGCVERYVNTDAIIGRVASAIADGAPSLAAQLVDGAIEKIDLNVLRIAAERDDALVNGVLEDVAKYLVVGISNVVACSAGFDRVVLGGGIEKLGDRFLSYVCAQAKVLGYRRRMDKVCITYTVLSSGNADSLGIAQQFVDRYLASTF